MGMLTESPLEAPWKSKGCPIDSMGSPSRFHGILGLPTEPQGLPWGCHISPMGIAWDSHGPWDFHGAPTGLHGTSMRLPWDSDKTRMGLPWNFHVKSMGELPLCFHGPSMGVQRDLVTHGASVVLPRCSHGAPMRLRWDLHGSKFMEVPCIVRDVDVCSCEVFLNYCCAVAL